MDCSSLHCRWASTFWKIWSQTQVQKAEIALNVLAGIWCADGYGHKVRIQSAIAISTYWCPGWLYWQSLQQMARGSQDGQKWRPLWRSSLVCGEALLLPPDGLLYLSLSRQKCRLLVLHCKVIDLHVKLGPPPSTPIIITTMRRLFITSDTMRLKIVIIKAPSKWSPCITSKLQCSICKYSLCT